MERLFRFPRTARKAALEGTALVFGSLLLLLSCAMENKAADEYDFSSTLNVLGAGNDFLAEKIIVCCQNGDGYYDAGQYASDGDWRSQWRSQYSNANKFGHRTGGGPDNPGTPTEEGSDGHHWITLDLGEHKEGIFRLKYQGVWDWYNGSIYDYEIYVSDSKLDVGHRVNPEKLAAKGSWSFTEWYGRNDPEQAIRYANFIKGSDGKYPSGQYVQLRSLFAEATDDPHQNSSKGPKVDPPWELMAAAEISVDFIGNFTEVNRKELAAAYGKAIALLAVSDRASYRVQMLITNIDAAAELLATEEPSDLGQALMLQGEMNRATKKLVDAIYLVNPPPKPVEY